MNDSYVYRLYVDGILRYIGMGKGRRVVDHLSIARRVIRKIESGGEVKALQVHLRLAEAILNSSNIRHRFVATGLSREAAKRLEIDLISKADRDQIWNVHSGGGGASPERMSELWSDPEWRAKQTALLKAAWDNPDYRAAMNKRRSDPKVRARISKAVSERFADEEERKRQSERIKAVHASRPELAKQHGARTRENWKRNRDKYVEAVTAHWSDPAHRLRQSEAAKRQWKDPEGREKLLLAARTKWTPELRKWRSEQTKKQLASPAARERMRRQAKERWADPDYRARVTQAIRASKARKKSVG